MTASILGHIKVLDLSRVLAGPWCTQALADMGATVYKIERPQVGDEMRQSPPFLTGPDGQPTTETVPFVALNRGKHSLTIDFTKEEGQALVLDLARRCDVMVENLKAGDLKRYGLDYESVRRVNPSVIYCSITGYGQDGPMAALPGYDPVFQAISGIMSTCGHPDDEPGGGPMRSMLPLVDVMTGMVSTSAVLAALLHRERTGEGQYLDTALLDVAMAATVHLGQTQLSTGRNPRRSGNGSLLFAPSNCFPCRDGLIFIQIGNDHQWKRLCTSLGREDWLRDPRFVGNANRVKHKAAVNEAVSSVTRNFEKLALSDQLGSAGVPCGPVNDMADAFNHPQVRHRQVRVDLAHPAHGTLPVIRSPFRFSRTPVEHRLPPTVLGADTRTVLDRELGMESKRWADLQSSGVV
jgi:crotonobetainyl-CoA:carnitine CoA-transferase CaiB-like acyl-CoA transferase